MQAKAIFRQEQDYVLRKQMDYKMSRMATSHTPQDLCLVPCWKDSMIFQSFQKMLQPEILQMKVQKSQEILAMYCIWAEIRTSVLSMNPISFIIWLSMKKKKA